MPLHTEQRTIVRAIAPVLGAIAPTSIDVSPAIVGSAIAREPLLMHPLMLGQPLSALCVCAIHNLQSSFSRKHTSSMFSQIA